MTGRLWVLGDSWTDPRDAENIRYGWPQQVAARLGLGLVCSGIYGAGYVSQGGNEGSTYPVQAVRGAGAGATAVVVWGSVNDTAYPPEQVHEAAEETYRLLRLACPGAPLLVYGPQMWSTAPDPRLYAVVGAVRAAAADAGALFVDPLLWFQDRPELEDGTAHPARSGHDLIADRVAVDLLFALAPTTTEPGDDAGGGRAYLRDYGGSRNYSPPSLPSAA